MNKQTGSAASQARHVFNPLSPDAAAAAAAGTRPGLRSGHVIDVSVGGNAGVLEMDGGEILEFAAAGATGSDLQDLHIGDHAWITTDNADQKPRELICPKRNRTLRVRLVPNQP
jgi:hypothetical protein